jgi:hypothetical protein
MRKFWERWYPLLFSMLLTLSTFLLFRRLNLSIPDSTKDLLTAATTLSGIIVGFLAATQAILFSIDNSKIIENLRQAGVYSRLINYLMDAIHWSLALAVISSVGLFLDLSNPQSWYLYPFFLWVFFSITTGLSCYRVIRLFNRILHSRA